MSSRLTIHVAKSIKYFSKEVEIMSSRWANLLAASASAVLLAVACIPAASAMLAANKLSAYKLSVNAQSDKTKFDAQAVTIIKVTLPDGTVLTLH